MGSEMCIRDSIFVVFLPLHLVHRFDFSTVIRGGESSCDIHFGSLFPELVPLGSLDPRRLSGLCGILGASN